MLLKSLVRSKTGSEYGKEDISSEELQINKLNWSKKLYNMVLTEGIPEHLHFDEELLTSVVINLFNQCLESMKKSFIYITISYCYKAQTLTIVIDEKGVSAPKQIKKVVVNLESQSSEIHI